VAFSVLSKSAIHKELMASTHAFTLGERGPYQNSRFQHLASIDQTTIFIFECRVLPDVLHGDCYHHSTQVASSLNLAGQHHPRPLSRLRYNFTISVDVTADAIAATPSSGNEFHFTPKHQTSSHSRNSLSNVTSNLPQINLKSLPILLLAAFALRGAN